MNATPMRRGQVQEIALAYRLGRAGRRPPRVVTDGVSQKGRSRMKLYVIAMAKTSLGCSADREKAFQGAYRGSKRFITECLTDLEQLRKEHS